MWKEFINVHPNLYKEEEYADVKKIGTIGVLSLQHKVEVEEFREDGGGPEA